MIGKIRDSRNAKEHEIKLIDAIVIKHKHTEDGEEINHSRNVVTGIEYNSSSKRRKIEE